MRVGGDKVAVALAVAAPHTPAQLVQLREAKALCMLHYHHAGFRDVDAHLQAGPDGHIAARGSLAATSSAGGRPDACSSDSRKNAFMHVSEAKAIGVLHHHHASLKHVHSCPPACGSHNAFAAGGSIAATLSANEEPGTYSSNSQNSCHHGGYAALQHCECSQRTCIPHAHCC